MNCIQPLPVVFEAGNVRTLRLVHLQPQKRLAEKAAVYFRKGSRYMKLHGAAALTGKVFGKVMNRKNRPVDYSKWIVKHLPDKAELAEERKTANLSDNRYRIYQR